MKIITGLASLAEGEINYGTFFQIKWTCKWSTDHHINMKRKYSAQCKRIYLTTNTMGGRSSSNAMMTGGFLSTHNSFSIVIHSPKPLESTIYLAVFV